jgi:hypothetical protein
LSSEPKLRGGLDRLATGLIAFGVAGLVAAVIGLAALVWAGGRIASLADTVDAEVAIVATTLDRTAVTLEDAGTSAVAFAATLDRTPTSVRQAAATIRNLRPNLEAIEAQLASINILGAQPLADAARLFGDMASDLEGLDDRLDLIAADLEADSEVLRVNAASLRQLADRTEAVAERIRAGIIQRGLGDLQAALVVTLLVFVAWTAIPSIGALVFGFWLRRLLIANPTIAT